MVMNPLIAVLLLSLIPAFLGAVGFNVIAKYRSHGDDTGKMHHRA
jgi:hypothetical protein